MPEQRKLAAVMFTDIIGYTRLMSHDEQKALRLLQKNRDIQKPLVKKYNGEFIKEIGDGTLLCFQSSLDAVQCALEIERAIKDDPELNLRIGIHLGDIVFQEGDVFGDGVNVASRIERLAEGGGICISEQVYETISNKPEMEAEFLGEKELKNVRHPIKVYTLREGSLDSTKKPVSKSSRLLSQKKRKIKRYLGIISLLALLTLLTLYTINRINQKRSHKPKEDLIAVAIFENQTGDKTLDPVGRMASDWITQGIAEAGLVTVVPSHILESTENTHQNMDRIRDLAEDVGAQTIITGVYYTVGNELQFHSHIVNAGEEKLISAIDPVSGPVDDPMISIELLRQKVMGVMAANFDENFKNYSSQILNPPLYEAYKEFLTGAAFFFKGDYEQANIHFNNATILDTTYFFPLFWVAVVYCNTNDYEKADSVTRLIKNKKGRLTNYEQYMQEHLIALLNGDLEETYLISSTLAQHTLLFKYQAAYDALKINAPQRTIDLLLPLEPDNFYFPGMYWNFLARAYHMLGHHREELKIAKQGREKHPTFTMNIRDEIRALAALGKTAEINQRLNESLASSAQNQGDLMLTAARELRAHGHKEESKFRLEQTIEWFNTHPDDKYRYLLAQAYYLAEQWDKSEKLFEILAGENPDDIDYLGYLGAIAARKDDGKESERINNLLSETDKPFIFGRNTFWLARIAAIKGEKKLAVQLLRDAVSQGEYYFNFHDLAAMDLESLHDYPPYQELIKPKK